MFLFCRTFHYKLDLVNELDTELILIRLTILCLRVRIFTLANLIIGSVGVLKQVTIVLLFRVVFRFSSSLFLVTYSQLVEVVFNILVLESLGPLIFSFDESNLILVEDCGNFCLNFVALLDMSDYHKVPALYPHVLPELDGHGNEEGGALGVLNLVKVVTSPGQYLETSVMIIIMSGLTQRVEKLVFCTTHDKAR